jgi:hypothetical protein
MATYKKENDIEQILANQIINGEVGVAKENQQPMNDDFELFVQLLDSDRHDKDYDWMSDIRIPEFASHHLTQSSIDVAQYFQTRDFVEVYLEDESEEAKANASASKELLNRTLNQRHLNHYLKFVRAKGLNNLCGRVYFKCWWEQKTEAGIVDYETHYENADVDVYGDPLIYPDQVPDQIETQIPIEGDIAVIDRFNYDVWDQRNVFTDNSYVYSLQQKEWVTFRSEMTLTELENSAGDNGYFNLDKLKEIKPAHKTQYKSETIDKNESRNPTNTAIEKPYDIYERYGAFWVVEKPDGSIKIGLDNEGKPLKNAVMEEVIITVAASDNKRCLIGFKRTPYIDASGHPYRPIIRGLCYVHLTEDGGVGDGKYTKELQIAIDDTFNISQDRVMLATLPTLSVNKHNIEDNSSLYFEPGHPMERTDKDDIVEFKVSDNITGALEQINMLITKMQQVDSVQPPSMGDTGAASTTATAYAGASYATGERTNYKSLTFEHTALVELYWMIQQMTYQFAKPETGIELMGDKVFDFDPQKNYYYKPLSQSIEPEYSKLAKRKEWSTILGYLAQIPHPDTVRAVNYVLGEIFKLMGDEYSNFSDKFYREEIPIQNQQGQEMVQQGSVPVSNQNLLPMSGAEMGTRGIANIGTF